MSNLVSQIKAKEYTDQILSDRQISNLLGGTNDRRYGQVKRAMKSGDLIQLKRGLYVISDQHRTTPIHPFAIAQAILPGSYISMESALSYHNWIPEAVYETISVTPGRKKLSYQHEQFGQFSYFPLALHRYQFLQCVKRHKVGTQHALIAEPLRALMDLVTCRKQSWSNLAWIEQGLRIELTNLLDLKAKDFKSLEQVYKHKRVRSFLRELKAEITQMKKAA